MMYPRLYLARNLLREDGVVCVSIDDREIDRLRMAMDEVFGEENFFATIAWQRKDTPSNDATGVSDTHEYVVIYQASEAFSRNLLPRTEEQLDNYGNPDDDPRGPWIRTSLIRKEEREGRHYVVKNRKGRDRCPPPGTSWRIPPKTFARLETEGCIWWGQDGDGDLPFLKRFLSEVQSGVVPVSWWNYQFAGSNRNAKMEIRALFDSKAPFDTPKPTLLIMRLLQITTAGAPDDLALDFFAGSGTTAHAVLEQNRQDGGNRKFILIQLPEPTGREDYSTVADITKERVRRVIKKLNDEDKVAAKEAKQLSLPGGARSAAQAKQPQDRGFRVFKLAESNFKTWDAEAPKDAKSLTKQLELHIDHIREGRTTEDILYEILLKSGFPLTTAVEKVTINQGSSRHRASQSSSPPLPKGGKTFYSVANGALLICLERELTLELIRAMAERKPERIVCLDAGFTGNDQLKANAVQIFKTKGVTSFKTV